MRIPASRIAGISEAITITPCGVTYYLERDVNFVDDPLEADKERYRL